MVVSQDNPVEHVLFVDVKESMKNGGGPACLRLRVVLTDEELSLTHQGIFLSKQLYKEIVQWGSSITAIDFNLKTSEIHRSFMKVVTPSTPLRRSSD